MFAGFSHEMHLAALRVRMAMSFVRSGSKKIGADHLSAWCLVMDDSLLMRQNPHFEASDICF